MFNELSTFLKDKMENNNDLRSQYTFWKTKTQKDTPQKKQKKQQQQKTKQRIKETSLKTGVL